jgi:hypothetical protein
MTSTEAARTATLAAIERQHRAQIAALPVEYLARIGLGTPEAIEAHVAAELADEAEALSA